MRTDRGQKQTDTASEGVNTLEGHTFTVWSVAFSPDGQFIVSGSVDNTLKLWSVREAKCLHTLEGHTATVYSVAFSPDGQFIVSGAEESTLKLWSVREAKCLHTLEGHANSVLSVAFSPDGQFIVSGSDDNTLKLWSVAALGLDGGEVAGEDTASYVNVKALIVGDTAVGKTGLATWLTTGKSTTTIPTVGAWSTVMQLPGDGPEGNSVSIGVWANLTPLPSTRAEEKSAPITTSREIWLWDFGGQSDYRLIHQLFMTDAALVILVFDAQRADFLESITRWDRDIALATGGDKPKLLVLGRRGLGGLPCRRSVIEDFCREKGFQGYFETDAHTDTGCAELRNAVIEHIDWDNLPRTVSPRIFKRLKEEILQLRDEGKVLLGRNELHLLLTMRMSGEEFAPEQFNAVLTLLSGPGIIWRLAFGDFILLRPEWINRYAWAMIRSVRSHPDEMGYITEEALTSGALEYGSDDRLPLSEERYVLIALHQTLIERALCLREKVGAGYILVFPFLYKRDRPDAPDTLPALATYRFTGFLEDIYASLVVRLHHTEAFNKTALWRNAADFETLSHQRVGIQLERLSDGHGKITLYADPSIPTDTQVNFELYANHHIHSKGKEVERTRRYVCSNCKKPARDYEAIAYHLEKKDYDFYCNYCKQTFNLWDEIEKRFASSEAREEVRRMNTEADITLDNLSKERILVGDVTKIVSSANHIFRETPHSDFGVDGEIEFRVLTQRVSPKDPTKSNDVWDATGKTVYVQLKSGDAYLRHRKTDNVEVFDIPDERHITYWQSKPCDVWLIFRASDGRLRWMNATQALKDRKDDGMQLIFNGEDFTVANLNRVCRRLLSV